MSSTGTAPVVSSTTTVWPATPPGNRLLRVTYDAAREDELRANLTANGVAYLGRVVRVYFRAG